MATLVADRYRAERSKVLGKIEAYAVVALRDDNITVEQCKEYFKNMIDLFNEYDDLTHKYLIALENS